MKSVNIAFATILLVRASYAIIIPVEPGASVQNALSESADQDTILLRPGHHRETVILPEHAVTLASNFILSGDSTDILNTVLSPADAESDTSSCIVVVSGEDVCHAVIGLTMRDGTGTATNIFAMQRSGGAVLAQAACVSIRHCLVVNCSAAFGGGVMALGHDIGVLAGYVEIDRCYIGDCKADENGGGVFAESCSLIVRNCQLLRDSCFHFAGGIEARRSYLNLSDTRVDSAYGLWSSLAVTSCEA